MTCIEDRECPVPGNVRVAGIYYAVVAGANLGLAAYPKQDRTASATPPYRLLRPPQEKCLGNVFAVRDIVLHVLTSHMQGSEEPQQDVSIVFFKIHYVEGCTVLIKPCPMLL